MTALEVSLAPLDSSDLGMVRIWRNDWRIMQWTRQYDYISDAEQIRWFNRQSEDPTIRMYKVQLTSTVKGDGDKDVRRTHTAGVAGLTSIDMKNRRAEFSLYIAPDLHGKGLGRAALQSLLKHAFTNLGLNLVWGETFDGNPAARMFEKLGFKKEGTRRQFYFRNGRFIDAHLYSITAEEFHERFSGDLADAKRDPAVPTGLAIVPRAHPARPGEPDQRVGEGTAGQASETEGSGEHGREDLAPGAEGARPDLN